MFSNLLAVATLALEAFIEASRDVSSFLAWYKKAQTDQWMQQSNQAFRPLEGPTTPDEKDTAAKNIGDLIRKL